MPSLLALLGSGVAGSPPTLGSPSFVYQNTTVTNDMASDGYNWAQAPYTVDKYGNTIVLGQKFSSASQRHFFIWSADGVTWTDNPSNTGHDGAPGEAFFERGCISYDSVQNALHVLWITVNPGDGGVIYRAYNIVYSGTTITAINRRAGVSVVLDGTNVADHYQHPVMLFMNDSAFGAHGGLFACWAARKGTNSEVRASMCNLGASGTTGGTIGNWAAPVTSSTTTLAGCQPDAVYTALVAQNNGAIPYPSIGRKSTGTHALDVYLLYASSDVGAWRWRRLRWNSGSSNWSTGMTTDTLITTIQRAGADTGYGLKNQLGTYVHEDTGNDRMLVGLATWKSNTDGDTWGFVLIQADDSLSSLVDAYSANGVHSFAPTGDVRYDAISNRIVVAWLTTTTEHVQVRLYDGTTTASSIITAYSTVSPNGADIPLLGPRQTIGANSVQPLLFRDRVDQAGAPLYRGLWGRLLWS